jgi:DNA polymerase-1
VFPGRCSGLMSSPIVGWDSLEAPTKRHEMFQSGRNFDDEVIEHLNVLPEFVAACGFANAEAPGFEADDFLAAAVAADERGCGSALVASGDRDAFQLAPPSTTILYPVRGGEIARVVPEEARRRYGVDPKQAPDFIALRGDPSDKLPGASRVGPKRAAESVRRYWSLDGGLDAGLFQSQAKKLRLYSNHRHDGCSCAVALAGRSGAHPGFSIEPRAQLGPQSVGGPLGGECITL